MRSRSVGNETRSGWVCEVRGFFALFGQARALQELLRQNAEELEKYKKLVASNQAVAGIEAEAAPAVNEGRVLFVSLVVCTLP